jgi:L-serine dehydratase
MKKSPSIFNDVIGPIMRGPSSSHTAASWRIAKMCLEILQEPLKRAVIDFDKNGAWAPNYREQGTTLGIDGGLLGLEMTDQLMKQTEQVAAEREIAIIYEVNSFKTKHVNTVRLNLIGTNGKNVKALAASLGGGAFEIQELNGFEVSIQGNYYELLIFTDEAIQNFDFIKRFFPELKHVSKSSYKGSSLINVKLSKNISHNALNILKEKMAVSEAVLLNPVLPVIAGNEKKVPYSTIDSLIKYSISQNYHLGKLGLIYEQSQSGLSTNEVNEIMIQHVDIINKSIEIGLKGTIYNDRILPQQSHLIDKAAKSGKILNNSIVNEIIKNVSAIMESKSAMEVVVANPTAGSCGAVGGVLKAVADELKSSKDELIEAYFAAGLVGIYFANGPGFSAEEHGCQVECGASAGMAAAGIVQLFGGTARQAIDAASMAIQNMIGLVCDPIADRVEAPCLGKNVSAAVNALSSATMVASGFNALIPLDEVISTVSRVSSQMPTCVKCTGKGGLAITKTACAIKAKLSSQLN